MYIVLLLLNHFSLVTFFFSPPGPCFSDSRKKVHRWVAKFVLYNYNFCGWMLNLLLPTTQLSFESNLQCSIFKIRCLFYWGFISTAYMSIFTGSKTILKNIRLGTYPWDNSYIVSHSKILLSCCWDGQIRTGWCWNIYMWRWYCICVRKDLTGQ